MFEFWRFSGGNDRKSEIGRDEDGDAVTRGWWRSVNAARRAGGGGSVAAKNESKEKEVGGTSPESARKWGGQRGTGAGVEPPREKGGGKVAKLAEQYAFPRCDGCVT